MNMAVFSVESAKRDFHCCVNIDCRLPNRFANSLRNRFATIFCDKNDFCM